MANVPDGLEDATSGRTRSEASHRVWPAPIQRLLRRRFALLVLVAVQAAGTALGIVPLLAALLTGLAAVIALGLIPDHGVDR